MEHRRVPGEQEVSEDLELLGQRRGLWQHALAQLLPCHVDSCSGGDRINATGQVGTGHFCCETGQETSTSIHTVTQKHERKIFNYAQVDWSCC